MAVDESDMPVEATTMERKLSGAGPSTDSKDAPLRATGKRDRENGPTTPSGEDSTFNVTDNGQPSSGNTQHQAKKGRILSRDHSTFGSAAVKDTFRGDDDVEISPPGTPTIPAGGPGRSRGASPLPEHSQLSVRNTAMDADTTPPATPVLPSRIAVGGTKKTAPETSRVKEMRERVQTLRTGDEAMLSTGDDEFTAPDSAHFGAPLPSVEAEIASLPASAAEAEQQARDAEDSPMGDAPLKTPTIIADLPPAAPLTAPAVNAIGKASNFVPPPSPASSVRAETGSIAGDSDYLTETSFSFSRPSTSRQSSVASTRANATSAYVAGMNSLSAPSPLVSSALPRNNSDTSFTAPSDALSDISTEVNPPETPRPLADIDTAPPTPVAGVRDASGDFAGTASIPASPSIASRGPAYGAAKPAAGSVLANFGRPLTSSFTSASPAPTPSSTSTTTAATAPAASKPFSNPFASFGSGTSSPFASSSSKPASSTASNLSSAKPFGSGFASTSSASPFASTKTSETKTNALDRAAVKSPEPEEGTEEADEAVPRANDKIFSSQAANEVRITGEEDEYVQFSLPRTKLFVLDGKEWKERGVGVLHVNSRSESEKPSVRLVMRAEAVHRLILNVSMYSKMSITLAQDKFVRFSAFEDSDLKHYTVRAPNAEQGQELYSQLQDMVKLLSESTSTNGAGEV